MTSPSHARPVWRRLLDGAQAGDHIVVDDFASLGADLDDVARTLSQLRASQLRLTVLSIDPNPDKPEAIELMLATVQSVARLLKQSQIERVKAGQTRARAAGKSIGRPSKLDAEQRQRIIDEHAAGRSIAALARTYRVSRGSIKRIID